MRDLPEHLLIRAQRARDELERRGQSELDEETYRRLDLHAALSESTPKWQLEGWHDGLLQVALPGVGAVRMPEAEAQGLANAILSEIEILHRGESEDW